MAHARAHAHVRYRRHISSRCCGCGMWADVSGEMDKYEYTVYMENENETIMTQIRLL